MCRNAIDVLLHWGDLIRTPNEDGYKLAKYE